jgi:hypothetical protein
VPADDGITPSVAPAFAGVPRVSTLAAPEKAHYG